MGRRIFKDDAHQKQYERDGFFAARVIGDEDVRKILEFFETLDAQTDIGFYASLDSPNPEFRIRSHEFLQDLIGNRIKELFVDYKHILFTPVIKRAGENTEFALHSDDEHLDESGGLRSINVWTPLVDVDERNGTLCVLPGSHRLPYPIRGIGLPFAYQDLIPAFRHQLVYQKLEAGTSLFFDSRIIHGSDDNVSDQPRPAFLTGMIPGEARPWSYLKHDQLAEDEVELFEAPAEFYLRTEIGKRPESLKSLGVFKIPEWNPTEEEFFRHLKPKSAGLKGKLKALFSR